MRYTYQSYPKNTRPKTAPIGDLCYQTALQREHHKSLTVVHFLKPLQKSLRTQNPCSTPPWTCTPWSQDAAQDGSTQSDSHLMGREEGIQKTQRCAEHWRQSWESWEVLATAGEPLRAWPKVRGTEELQCCPNRQQVFRQ